LLSIAWDLFSRRKSADLPVDRALSLRLSQAEDETETWKARHTELEDQLQSARQRVSEADAHETEMAKLQSVGADLEKAKTEAAAHVEALAAKSAELDVAKAELAALHEREVGQVAARTHMAERLEALEAANAELEGLKTVGAQKDEAIDRLTARAEAAEAQVS